MKSLIEAVSLVKGEGENSTRAYFEGNFPDTMRALRIVDTASGRPRRGKGYNLAKRENRKLGFVYYARFYHEGKMLPTKWNTHTTVLEEAERFAEASRETPVGWYLKARDTRMYEFLEKFYAPGSDIPVREGKRNRRLSEGCRAEYRAVIVKRFIPFLKREGIADFAGISGETLSGFQDFLLSGGVKPQTVNNKMKAARRIFEYLARKGAIAANPCAALRGIPVGQGDRWVRGCYELGKVKGVFKRKWKDEVSYLLCLLIYATGMRNGEIKRLRMADIVTIGGSRFIDIRESKTAAGTRLAPLHDAVYRRLKAYAVKTKKGKDETVLNVNGGRFRGANYELAWRLKVSEEEVEREHITFYSGRHYWKTLMSCEGLGEDVEELFMGHKVSGDVRKLYNHKDKRGTKQLARKARQVFAILDRSMFGVSRG